ncbi:MAG: amidophosphoribosyltransferase [Christensenellales bacterium]
MKRAGKSVKKRENAMFLDKLHEECAVFGVSLNAQASPEAGGIAYNALLAMQHRGQESAGIAVTVGQAIHCIKDLGLVNDVFPAEVLHAIPESDVAIGHSRYSSSGYSAKENVQPFVTEFLTGRIATANNGNVTNAKEIREFLEPQGVDFSATSDSEVLSSLMAYNILREVNALQGAVKAAKQLKGAFSLVLITSDKKLIAIRDANGFRPLCIGRNEFGMVVASESCAVEGCGFEFVRDLAPGEILVIEEGEITYSGVHLNSSTRGLCIFEYVYFARTDSVIDGLSVYEARFNMGKELAKEYPVDADVVCGVPDSGLEAAMGYAAQSGLPLVSGFVKNRYIGRSFIYPSQSQREEAVRMKLNPLKYNVQGKRIVLIDDSIVRGTTSAKIIRSLREAGAKEVHFRVSSPPFVHTCHYGTDIGDESALIANQMSKDEISKKIDADSLGFISVQGLLKACKNGAMPFCTGCFTGEYGIEWKG